MIEVDYWLSDWTHRFLWVVILSFLMCFLLSFGMGANDCANSYGLSIVE